jgi:transcriptional regulator with PAS, ATPase and Fis domain
MSYLELTGEIEAGRIVALANSPIVIGRGEDCDLSIVNSHISRRHAVVTPCKDGWLVEDLGSKNGIVINGKVLSTALLKHGDVIGIGPLEIRYYDTPIQTLPQTKIMDREAVTRIIVGDQAGLESQRRLRLLLEIAAALDSFDTPDDLLAKFGDLVVHLFSPSSCVVELADQRWQYALNISNNDTYSEMEALLDKVKNEGEAFLQGDVSVMAAPIISGVKPLGVLFVYRDNKDMPCLEEDDLLLLIGVGRLVSAAALGADKFQRLDAENRLLRAKRESALNLVGESRSMNKLRETIEKRVGPVKATVLITGETGTGKSAVAEAIHLASPRKKGPFIKINCAAIPKDLLESELFGHEKGSFSGATKRKMGQFEAAAGGTILLDEVAELDPSAQAKLLAVVQDRQLLRVGSIKPIEVDVRIVAASNRELKRAVENGTFRSDLYYRLNVIRLEIPPLRERKADIKPLALFFLHRSCREIGKRIPGIREPAFDQLLSYSWPGNVRELANSIERAVIYGDEGEPLDLTHFPSEIRIPEASSGSVNQTVTELGEKDRLLAALAQSGGNKRETARILGWYPQKLYDRLKRYGLTAPYRSEEKD